MPPSLRKNTRILYLLPILIFSASFFVLAQQNDAPQTDSTVFISGQLSYTSPLFTLGVSEPVIILEDQTGFIRRDRGFVFPPETQVMGQITSDFYTSPFAYSLALPIEPRGILNDVDNDGEPDAGVMVFAVAFWSNAFGDAFLEQRDQFGGGWSTAYASTRTSTAAETIGEYVGGKLLIYAPDDAQAFPSGFGDDGLLFTSDDPIAPLSAGYTVVDMDTTPFTFDRSRQVTIDLIEGQAAAPDDFRSLDIVSAFDAMVAKLRREYAFTDYKSVDWDALSAQYRPRVVQSQHDRDSEAYYLAIRDFLWSIPDGHIDANITTFLIRRFLQETEAGIGLTLRELDDGRVIATHIVPNSPAEQAGIRTGAQVIAINNQAIAQFIDAVQPWSSPFSTDHDRRYQQVRYATRFKLGDTVRLTYRNPDDEQTRTQTATLTPILEQESFAISSLNRQRTGYELPVQYRPLPDGYVYAEITSFSDDERLSIQLWERMIRTAKQQNAPAIILDMRNNGGGSGFLADQMAAYFFQESHVLGNKATYDAALDQFVIDPNTQEVYYLPPEELRYDGPVVVLVGTNCLSACEFFAYNMTLADRATIIGQTPTGGLGGSISQFFMPGSLTIQYTSGRKVDADGNIHIEGIGVIPDVRVLVTEETVFSTGDPVLEAAITFLDAQSD